MQILPKPPAIEMTRHIRLVLLLLNLLPVVTVAQQIAKPSISLEDLSAPRDFAYRQIAVDGNYAFWLEREGHAQDGTLILNDVARQKYQRIENVKPSSLPQFSADGKNCCISARMIAYMF